MSSKPKGKAKRKVAIVIACYIIASGNVLFYLLIDYVIGIKETTAQYLMLVFFWAWIALLFYIERRYFKGLYEELKDEE